MPFALGFTAVLMMFMYDPDKVRGKALHCMQAKGALAFILQTCGAYLSSCALLWQSAPCRQPVSATCAACRRCELGFESPRKVVSTSDVLNTIKSLSSQMTWVSGVWCWVVRLSLILCCTSWTLAAHQLLLFAKIQLLLPSRARPSVDPPCI